MEIANVMAAVVERLPLIFIFTGGYLLYRLMAETRVTDAFILWTLRRSRGSRSGLVLYVIIAAALLSAFIPNTITVLTMLPVLKALDAGFREQGDDDMTTILMVAAIYGAGIGGTTTMIGSPANAVLLAALDVLDVSGRENITFLNWFIWSVPLVIMLILAAWAVAAGLGLGRERTDSVPIGCMGEQCEINARQRYGVRLFCLFMGFWVLRSVLLALVPSGEALAPWPSTLFFSIFLYLVFLRRAPDADGHQGALLRANDLIKDIPRRGLLFVLLLAVIFGVVRLTGADRLVADWGTEVLSIPMPYLLFFFVAVLSVIFLTEVLSNTVVVAGFFTIVFLAANARGIDPLPLMVGVSVASTCAFMTPVATPVNALAFGEMRGASLKRMLILGFVLNVLAAALLTGWLTWVLPLVY